MATNPSTLLENVGRITPPNANYIYGSAKDDTTGTTGDGTPIKKALMNDSYGFFQAAMVAAGIVPSGNAETVLESQVLQALQGVVGSFSDKKQWPTVANGADTDHDIVFSAGKITDSDGMLPVVTAGLTKQIDNAWVAGTNVGGLFSGSVAASTTYHLFLIVKDLDLSVDAGFDTDPDAANIPTGYTSFRRIASLYTDGSSNLVQFYQQGDYFGLVSGVTDLAAFQVSSTVYTNRSLSVPRGLSNIIASILASTRATGPGFGGSFYVRLAPTTDVAPDPGGVTTDNSQLKAIHSGSEASIMLEVPVGNASQVRIRSVAATSAYRSDIQTFGWTDDRG